ncbi:hypothetical protein [Indioceanicola profundi]|uniref:hypothetical protein n=1 Tax=Indioceanicola profundi TaxID=2220096 RepID=UPI001CEDE8A1|nr:hypothetical protein [Indioceanicola profundi]
MGEFHGTLGCIQTLHCSSADDHVMVAMPLSTGFIVMTHVLVHTMVGIVLLVSGMVMRNGSTGDQAQSHGTRGEIQQIHDDIPIVLDEQRSQLRMLDSAVQPATSALGPLQIIGAVVFNNRRRGLAVAVRPVTAGFGMPLFRRLSKEGSEMAA